VWDFQGAKGKDGHAVMGVKYLDSLFAFLK
jgi:hypothetical protein